MRDRQLEIQQLKLKLEELKAKVGTESLHLVQEVEEKLNTLLTDLTSDFYEEVDEYKEVGFVGWVQSNPRKAMGIAAALVAVIAVLGTLF
jgi:hypothetical protein